MGRNNLDKVYSFRDSEDLKEDIIRCAKELDMKDSEFLRYAIKKLIKEMEE